MNLLDYAKKHKNEDFKTHPFHEVDAFIFSLFPYLDFTDIVPAFKKKPITIQEAYLKLKQKRQSSPFFRNTFKLLELIYDSKRYQDILLLNYMRVVNEEMQFGALTIKLPDKTTFISFAGTDTSIIGWEEDFKMAYLYPGASQKYASIYLNKAIRFWDRRVFVGGHSKGGNLAISSAMNAKFFVRNKIKQIYNFDGPGFLKEQVESKPYKNVANKIKMYVPEESIIGMILYHVDDYMVVKAKHFSILQHDAFHWLFNDFGFIPSKQNKRSKNLEMKLTKKLESLSISERLKLVQDVFHVFKLHHIKDTQDIKLNNILSLIKSFSKLDKETKNLLTELLVILFIK